MFSNTFEMSAVSPGTATQTAHVIVPLSAPATTEVGPSAVDCGIAVWHGRFQKK